MAKISTEELLDFIEKKIGTGDFLDSVHKIKLITTKEMIISILKENIKSK